MKVHIHTYMHAFYFAHQYYMKEEAVELCLCQLVMTVNRKNANTLDLQSCRKVELSTKAGPIPSAIPLKSSLSDGYDVGRELNAISDGSAGRQCHVEWSGVFLNGCELLTD